MSGPSRRCRSLALPLLLAAIACTYALAGWAGHTCVVVAGGAVWCWGYNSRGELGDGTAWDRSRPVQVQGLPTATSVAAGSGFTCAVTGDGRVFCWGRNDRGQLGVAASGDRSTPVEVAGLSGVTAVAAGERAACAIASGVVSCWGRQAGADYAGVTAIPGLPSGAVKVVLDEDRACALLATGGEVWCWRPGGAASSAGISGALDLALLQAGLCTLQAGGAIYCGGSYSGEGVALDARNGDACALSAGSISCMGAAALGKPTLPAPATAVSVGDGYACALLSTGEVACWGDNWGGQLGDGTDKKRAQPVVVEGLTGSATALSASPALRVYHSGGCGLAEYPQETSYGER